MKAQIESVVTDKRMTHLEAILNSMTPRERANTQPAGCKAQAAHCCRRRAAGP